MKKVQNHVDDKMHANRMLQNIMAHIMVHVAMLILATSRNSSDFCLLLFVQCGLRIRWSVGLSVDYGREFLRWRRHVHTTGMRKALNNGHDESHLLYRTKRKSWETDRYKSKSNNWQLSDTRWLNYFPTDKLHVFINDGQLRLIMIFSLWRLFHRVLVHVWV